MEDLALQDLFKKVFIFLFIVFVFGGLLLLVLNNRFLGKDLYINKMIDKKESFLVLIVSEDNRKPKDIIRVLDNSGISYYMMNKDREKYYNDFLKKLKISKDDISTPCILTIQKGEVISILPDVKENEGLMEYIEYYKEV